MNLVLRFLAGWGEKRNMLCFLEKKVSLFICFGWNIFFLIHISHNLCVLCMCSYVRSNVSFYWNIHGIQVDLGENSKMGIIMSILASGIIIFPVKDNVVEKEKLMLGYLDLEMSRQQTFVKTSSQPSSVLIWFYNIWICTFFLLFLPSFP